MIDEDRIEPIDCFMPINLVYNKEGMILHVGPTLAKILDGHNIVGKPLKEVLTVLDDGRNKKASKDEPIVLGTPLFAHLNQGFSAQLKGLAKPLPGTPHYLLSLSFGLSIIEAVAQYKLTASDFAVTDLAIELLYLFEAKSAVLEETKQLTQRLHGAKLQAEEQSFTDALTGLKNRRALQSFLENLVKARDDFALMQLDLDYFKNINDQFGHAAGDFVLEKVSTILENSARKNDFVARVGGDEFILIFPSFIDKIKLIQKARDIIRELEVPIPFEGNNLSISGSAGITTTIFYDTVDMEKMMKDADSALYLSKEQGRGRANFYEP